MKRKNRLVSSKDVLRSTKISRATLNNYIKMGILPKPIVQKPEQSDGTVRKMGYFPREVVDRVEEVRRLKREGHSMVEIITRLGEVESEERDAPALSEKPIPIEKNDLPDEFTEDMSGKEVRLSLDYMSYGSYVLNNNFEILWINDEAENEILCQAVSRFGNLRERNIFKVLFTWELHGRIQNWKDLLGFHMAFVKEKYTKTWIKKLYTGISDNEVALLEDMYEKVPIPGENSIRDTHLNLLKIDGTTNSYRVLTLTFREGTLFSYIPLS